MKAFSAIIALIALLYPVAAALLGESIEEKVNSTQEYIREADTHAKAGKHDSLMWDYEHAPSLYKALEKNDEAARARMQAADEGTKAAEEFAEAGEHYYSAGYYRRAVFHYEELGKNDEAAEMFMKAVDEYVKTAKAYIEAGAHEREGWINEKIALVGWIYEKVAGIYKHLGEEGKVVEMRQEAINIYLKGADVYAKAGDQERSAWYYERAVPVYEALGDKDKAAEARTKAGKHVLLAEEVQNA